jgi:hypothetical protein
MMETINKLHLTSGLLQAGFTSLDSACKTASYVARRKCVKPRQQQAATTLAVIVGQSAGRLGSRAKMAETYEK